jgi:hypothetical protein
LETWNLVFTDISFVTSSRMTELSAACRERAQNADGRGAFSAPRSRFVVEDREHDLPSRTCWPTPPRISATCQQLLIHVDTAHHR